MDVKTRYGEYQSPVAQIHRMDYEGSMCTSVYQSTTESVGALDDMNNYW